MNLRDLHRSIAPDLNALLRPYVCGGCGKGGCKLWRTPEATNILLFCARCACQRNPRVHVEDVDRHGRHTEEMVPGTPFETDTIGWYVPAIPVEGTERYVAYAEVSDALVVWWSLLPTDPDVIDVESEEAPNRPLLTDS